MATLYEGLSKKHTHNDGVLQMNFYDSRPSNIPIQTALLYQQKSFVVNVYTKRSMQQKKTLKFAI
jgi:hypothetical protein